MNNHIEERRIELVLLNHPDISNEEKKEIFSHLEVCSLCKENYFKLKNFYEEIESEIVLEPSNEDIDFAQRSLTKKSFLATKLLEGPKKAVKIYDGWVEITEPFFGTQIQKFVRFVRRHPKGFTGSLAFASLILVLLVYTSTIKTKNNNPSYAWVENQVLYVQNLEGQILWKMNVPGLRNTNSNITADLNKVKNILVGDVDSDYKNDVLITGNFLTDFGTLSDSLFCYDFSGKLKWKTGGWEFPSVNARKWLHTKWNIRNFVIIKDFKKDTPRLFVLANDNVYSPAIFMELDGKTGKVLQNFYNVGGTVLISSFDLDGDGQYEVLLGGINDPYRRAYLAVFDINKISGYSPYTEEYLPKDITFGNFKYYIILPFTELGHVLGNANYNCVKYIKETKNKLIIATEEVLGLGDNKTSSVLYNFDHFMNVTDIIVGDDFAKNHRVLMEEGKLNEKLDEAFFENLKNSVLYWDGEKFVDSVSVNKYYKPTDTITNR